MEGGPKFSRWRWGRLENKGLVMIGGGSKKCSIFGIYHPPPPTPAPPLPLLMTGSLDVLKLLDPSRTQGIFLNWWTSILKNLRRILNWFMIVYYGRLYECRKNITKHCWFPFFNFMFCFIWNILSLKSKHTISLFSYLMSS